MIHRMEERSMNAWPALQTYVYDGWVIRFSYGYTKRANSVYPIYSSTLDLEEKITHCEKLYTSMQLPVVYKLTKNCCPADLDQVLEIKGYQKLAETALRIAQIKDNAGYNGPYEVMAEYEFTKEWISTLISCTNMSDTEKIDVMKRMLNNIIGDKICVRINIKEEPIACGFGVIEDGYIGIYDIVVKPEFRGRGYGRAIMQGLLKEALKKNIDQAYLQVVVGNTVAEKLYDSLGFKEVYRYWYREKSFLNE